MSQGNEELTFNGAFLKAVQAILVADLEARQLTGNQNFKNPALRYVLGEYIKTTHPERVNRDAIPHSKGAYQAIQTELAENGKLTKSFDKLGVRYEHQVPLRLLHERLLEVHRDLAEIDRILARDFQCAHVTHAEDKAINAAGYRSSVPTNGQNRYEAVGLEMVDPRTGEVIA